MSIQTCRVKTKLLVENVFSIFILNQELSRTFFQFAIILFWIGAPQPIVLLELSPKFAKQMLERAYSQKKKIKNWNHSRFLASQPKNQLRMENLLVKLKSVVCCSWTLVSRVKLISWAKFSVLIHLLQLYRFIKTCGDIAKSCQVLSNGLANLD